MFASNSLPEHLLRGLVGVVSIWWAIAISGLHPIGSVMLGVVTLVAFRGCPVCWTMGLVETAQRSWKGANG